MYEYEEPEIKTFDAVLDATGEEHVRFTTLGMLAPQEADAVSLLTSRLRALSLVGRALEVEAEYTSARCAPYIRAVEVIVTGTFVRREGEYGMVFHPAGAMEPIVLDHGQHHAGLLDELGDPFLDLEGIRLHLKIRVTPEGFYFAQ